MRYDEDTMINEDILFCKPIKENQQKWSDCVGVCISVVHVMVENEGPQALIKPEATWTHLQYIF
jgi:hypothetical protein